MIFLFWDKFNDELELMGEDGEFYLYGQDDVGREQGLPDDRWQYWLKVNKIRGEASPLTDWDRYEFYSELSHSWIPWKDASKEEIQMIHRHAGDEEWDTAHE